MTSTSVPARLRASARREAKFTANLVRELQTIMTSPRLVDLPGVAHDRLALDLGMTNPSSVVSNGVEIVMVRQVSYSLSRFRRRMIALGRRQRLATGPYLVSGALPHVPNRLMPSWTHGPKAAELEDGRIFEWRGSLHALFSVSARFEDGIARMALVRIDGGEMHDLRLIPSPHQRAREKNWMPLVDGDRLLLGYDVSRGEFYEVLDDVVLRRVHGAEDPADALSGHLGTSQFVRHGDGWIGITHQSVVRPLAMVGFPTAFYLHHVVELNDSLETLRISPPFFIRRRGVEFCGGLRAVGDGVELLFGAEDARTERVAVSEAVLDGLLSAEHRHRIKRRAACTHAS